MEAWRGDRYDVTAVGDPQQAIYGWNGADAGFLLDIHRWWPPAEIIELERSYRSTPQILDGAAAVLRGARQAARSVTSTRAEGAPPHVQGHPTDRAEAIAIARAIRLARAPGRPWSEQAVLVRTHAQTHLIAEALREAGIPHRVRGGAAFLDRPDVRRALRELRSAAVPLGTALADLELQLEVRAEHDDSTSGPTTPTPTPTDVVAAAALDRRADETAALAALLRMGRDYLRLDPVGRADTFSTWLTATVQSEGDTGGPARDAVDLATFHAAKGLEWVTVHIAGAEDGYVPISYARTAAARAEEARLLYVAMTRAQRELNITWAEQRTFASKVVDRRRSPLLDPLLAAAAAGAASEPLPGTATPGAADRPVADWTEELARQRELLPRGDRRATSPIPCSQSLRHWRDGAARAARIDPEAVLPDHVLSLVVAARPRDVDELGAVRGVGPILASRFGDAMLRRARGRRAVTHEVQHRAALRRRRGRGGPGLHRPRPVRRARRAAQAVAAGGRGARGRGRHRAAAGAVPLRRGAVRGRPRGHRPGPAHVGRGSRPTTSPRAPPPSRCSPTTTPIGSSARAPTGSRPPTAAAGGAARATCA